MAQNIDPSVYIGKNGMTENVINEIDTLLEHRELVKVRIREAAGLDAKVAANEAAQILKAEFVAAIGRVFVLYRESKEYKEIILPRG